MGLYLTFCNNALRSMWLMRMASLAMLSVSGPDSARMLLPLSCPGLYPIVAPSVLKTSQMGASRDSLLVIRTADIQEEIWKGHEGESELQHPSSADLPLRGSPGNGDS